MSLEQEYLYATECQLATLEQLCCRKSASKSDKRRHRTIAFNMLKACQEFIDVSEIEKRSAGWAVRKSWGRVTDTLWQAKSEPEGLNGAIDRFISELESRY
jgi:hypothetical protein